MSALKLAYITDNRILGGSDVEVIIYEPTLKVDIFEKLKVDYDLDNFKNTYDVILANRYSEELEDIKDKVYTRDIFLID